MLLLILLSNLLKLKKYSSWLWYWYLINKLHVDVHMAYFLAASDCSWIIYTYS